MDQLEEARVDPNHALALKLEVRKHVTTVSQGIPKASACISLTLITTTRYSIALSECGTGLPLSLTATVLIRCAVAAPREQPRAAALPAGRVPEQGLGPPPLPHPWPAAVPGLRALLRGQRRHRHHRHQHAQGTCARRMPV